MLVPRVERRDVVGLAADDRAGEARDPLGRDAAQIAVHHRARTRAQKIDRLEDRAERGALSRATLVAAGHDRHAVG